jgi:hypothetical protein
MNKKQKAAAAKKRRVNARHRWKDVERKVAVGLNAIYSDVGKSTVGRLPVNGREGPDLSVNEVGLVVNVKSRQIVHPRLFPEPKQLLTIGDLVCFRLEDLARMNELVNNAETEPLKALVDWYWFMDKWTREFKPDGITCIIIHRPGMPIGKCGIVIHFNDLKRLSCQLQPIPSH